MAQQQSQGQPSSYLSLVGSSGRNNELKFLKELPLIMCAWILPLNSEFLLIWKTWKNLKLSPLFSGVNSKAHPGDGCGNEGALAAAREFRSNVLVHTAPVGMRPRFGHPPERVFEFQSELPVLKRRVRTYERLPPGPEWGESSRPH